MVTKSNIKGGKHISAASSSPGMGAVIVGTSRLGINISDGTGDLTIENHLSINEIVKLFKAIAPEKMEELVRLSMSIRWALTEELIKEGDFDHDFLLKTWGSFCEVYNPNDRDKSGVSIFETIVSRTEKRLYLNKYERLSIEHFKGIYDSTLIRVIEIINERREEIPNSVDFIKDD